MKSRSKISKIFDRLSSMFINLFLTDTNRDPNKSVLIIGTTRSGTTFLMEQLNARKEYRTMFEPFNPEYTKEWYGFSARHYVDPQNATHGEKFAIHQILTGNISNSWVDRYNKKIRVNKRLIKAVRANLLVPYIHKNYPETPLIYLKRNPFEVIASRINLNFDPEDVFLILAHQNFISNYYTDISLKELKSLLTTRAAKHAALWCLENRFLMTNQEHFNLLILDYKDIIGNSIALKDEELVIKKELTQPSATTFHKAKYVLCESEIANIKDILNIFNISTSIF